MSKTQKKAYERPGLIQIKIENFWPIKFCQNIFLTYRLEVLGGRATFTTNTIIYVRETKFNIREKLYNCWKVFKMRGLRKVKFFREFQMTELVSSNQVRANIVKFNYLHILAIKSL